MPKKLSNRVALITGTAGGQGRAAAVRFAAEGATVVGCDLNAAGSEETVAMVEETGGKMTATAPVDLGDPKEARDWVEAAAAEHGGIDILYNNASAPSVGTLTEMSDEDWRLGIRNELDLVFYVSRAAWPFLAKSEHASVINTASMQGMVAVLHVTGGFAHAMAKHGILGLTRELASEGSADGIRVNAISPGIILTPPTAGLADMPDLQQKFFDHQMIKRLGQPEDIAGAALFLASDDASFVTGANLVVDGGYTAG